METQNNEPTKENDKKRDSRFESRTSQEGQTNLNQFLPLQIKRSFHAPVERLWSAWSEPELIRQWWGPQRFSCPNADIDFRVGGQYLLAMQDSSGKVMWSGGIFKEIVPNKKIVWTDHFADKNGKPMSARDIGMPGDWPKDLLVTIEFDSVNADQTKMVLTHQGIPKEMQNDCIEGWSESIDKLQRLVERN